MTLDALLALEPYWEAVRALYAPFEAGLRSADRPRLPPRDPRRPALQPAPAGRRDRRRRPLRGGRGGLRAGQRAARQHHQGDADEQGRRRPRDLRRLGRDRPRRARARRPSASTCPTRCSTSCAARSAARPAGFPQPFTDARAARPAGSRRRRRPLDAETLEALAGAGAARASRRSPEILFPGPLRDYLEARERHGDVSLLPTAAFFYGLREGEALPVDLAPGVRVIFELEAIGEPDETGMRTVMTRVNGQLRPARRPRPLDRGRRSPRSSAPTPPTRATSRRP